VLHQSGAFKDNSRAISMTRTPPDGKVGPGLNAINQGFEAGLFHPDFGNEVIGGRIFLDRWKLRFQSDSVAEEIPMDAVEIEFEQGGDRIYFHDPNRPDLKIFTSDQSVLKHPAIRQCGALQAQVATVLGRRELSRALRVTVYFFIGCIFATWFCSMALSFMVRTIAAQVPMEWEDRFGREEIDKLRTEGALLDDTNQIAQLTELAQPLIKVLPENRRNLKFYIMDDADPNAFALPGGYVVVHTGMLQMTETPEELLGVLAHEIAHETQRHMIRHRIAAAGPLVIFGLFLHSRSGAGNLLALGSGLMIYQGFSQEYETEADDVGWKYLVAANIDPRGMIRTFQKLKASEDSMGFSHLMPEAFASHPALAKRIARLEGKWKKLDRKTGFLELPPVSWPKPKDWDDRTHFPVINPKEGTND
jgi:Zn-dependent protease with chaperone function